LRHTSKTTYKMTKSITKYLFVAAFLIAGTSLFSQKYGYINSAELLIGLSEVKAADTSLETYQKQLMAKGEQMVKALQTKYQTVSAEVQKGTMSQIQIQQKEQELQTEQQKIQTYEVEVQQKLAQKREELYKPILDKVKDVIIAYGKAEGYTMIFDTSTGGLLHANDSDNLLSVIKAKLVQ